MEHPVADVVLDAPQQALRPAAVDARAVLAGSVLPAGPRDAAASAAARRAAPPDVRDLVQGGLCTAEDIRKAICEAELRRAHNARMMQDAGERGQQLLEEEQSLLSRMEECRRALASSGKSVGSSPGGGFRQASECVADEDFLRRRRRSSDAGGRDDSRAQPAVLEQLRLQNALLEEELEEREHELTALLATADQGGVSSPRFVHTESSSAGVARQRSQKRSDAEAARIVELKSEIAKAQSLARATDEARDRERRRLEAEVEEVRQQVDALLARLHEQIQDGRRRCEALLEDAARLKEESERQTQRAGHAVERLRDDLAAALRCCAGALREGPAAEVAAVEEGCSSPWRGSSTTAAESLDSVAGSAAETPLGSRRGSRASTSTSSTPTVQRRSRARQSAHGYKAGAGSVRRPAKLEEESASRGFGFALGGAFDAVAAVAAGAFAGVANAERLAGRWPATAAADTRAHACAKMQAGSDELPRGARMSQA